MMIFCCHFLHVLGPTAIDVQTEGLVTPGVSISESHGNTCTVSIQENCLVTMEP